MSTPVETRVSPALSVFTYGSESLATSYGANATVFFGKGAVAIVDPFVSPLQAAELDARIASRSAGPVTHVVLTHHHTDHALGALHFVRKGAEVIAHAAAAERMAQEHPRLIAERRAIPEVAELFAAAEAYVPARLLTAGLVIDVGGLRLDVFHPGHAHTPGDLCVYEPSLGVLVSGDIVSAGYHANLEDASVPGWRAALAHLRTLPFWTLVPGHGPVSGREALDAQLAWFDAAERALREAAGPEEAVARLKAAFPTHLLAFVLPDVVARLGGSGASRA